MPTNTENHFLNYQKISTHLVLDVKRLSKKEYHKQIRKTGAVIVMAATPFKAQGNTIRIRAGL